MPLPPKVSSAIDVLTSYDVEELTVAPHSYRWFLRWRPDTPPPLWDAAPGYWTFLALVAAFTAGVIGTALATFFLLSYQGGESQHTVESIFFLSQFVGWAVAGGMGAAWASESRRSFKSEREALGLPAWEAFNAGWRPSLAALRERSSPERFWLRSLWKQPLVGRGQIAGIAAFALLGWALPVKAGTAGAGFAMAYFAICILGLGRTLAHRPMPVAPRLWQFANGFWIGFYVAAVVWVTIVADIWKLPVDRSIYLFGALCLVTHAIEWSMFEQQKNVAMRAERVEQARLLSEARLAALKAQIEPHFIFNTLANLKSFIATNPKLAERLADELADFLRSSLNSLRRDSTTVREDVELVRAYLEITRLRMGERLSVIWDIAPDVQDQTIPPLMLLTLVENAVQHGIEPKAGPGTIRIAAEHVHRDGVSRLVITVADDGVGFGAASSGGSGVGLANLRERLASLHGDAAMLNLRAGAAGGLTAELDLPMNVLNGGMPA